MSRLCVCTVQRRFMQCYPALLTGYDCSINNKLTFQLNNEIIDQFFEFRIVIHVFRYFITGIDNR